MMNAPVVSEIEAIQNRLAVVQAQVEKSIETTIEMTMWLEEQLDFLKSSLSVPVELVEDFRRWRVETPVSERPLVSVCIATYNRARLLTERAIPSVLSQTYKNLELIVVGDGCSDETEELVRGIGDPRLRFHDLGSSHRVSYPDDPLRRWMVAGTAALNEALSLARGEYVTHLDDDDEYLPERLERLVDFARTHDGDFLWHPFWYKRQNDAEWFLSESKIFARTFLTTSSVFYRSWFTRIPWDLNAHLLQEPGDWNRFRKIKFLNPVALRYPEPLLRHYPEQAQLGE
jgi:glycosyltransferase involved in cell wall biosynthesis